MKAVEPKPKIYYLTHSFFHLKDTKNHNRMLKVLAILPLKNIFFVIKRVFLSKLSFPKPENILLI